MNSVIGLVAAGLLLQGFLWGVQLRTRNAATVDVGWALLVAVGAVWAAWVGTGDPTRRLVVGGLAAVWALRLAAYLIRDRVLGPVTEDGRYRALREHWGPAASRNLLALYLAQVLIAAIFVLPLAAAMRGGPPDLWMAAGVVVWLLAIVGEWVADRQLERFRADPATRGTVCRVGLWRYSRHPNYFGEWLHWWAYVLIGHAQALTFLGPAAMLLFLFRLTGIPHTERQALRSRGEGYREYQRTTSIFIPWPPADGGIVTPRGDAPYRLERRQLVGGSLGEVFGFFKSPENLERLTPAWLGFRILASSDPLVCEGTLISYRLHLWGIPFRWRSRIAEYQEGRMFADEQVAGPYQYWYHRHRFEAVPGGVIIADEVEYQMPFGPLGRLVHAAVVRRQLAQIFDHRARVIRERFPLPSAPTGQRVQQ